MSSTNKTENFGLNNWLGTDKPERTDFNRDNEIIDREMSNHIYDSSIHIRDEERDRWTNFFYSGVYYGNGELSREIDTGCPFPIGFGFIFADEKPFAVSYYDEKQHRNYAGFFYRGAANLGLYLGSNNKLKVKLSASAEYKNEYVNFNERGVVYHYFLFRDVD